MGLSKDNTDISEEVEKTELSSAKKRRLRRQKLQLAKAEALSNKEDVPKICSTNTVGGPDNSIAPVLSNNQCHGTQVSCKKQKFKCESLVLNNTQNSRSIESNLATNNQQSKSQKADLVVENKKSTDITKNKDSKSDTAFVVDNLNTKSGNKTTKRKEPVETGLNVCDCETSVLNRKQKSKSKNLVYSESQKAKSETQVLIDNPKTQVLLENRNNDLNQCIVEKTEGKLLNNNKKTQSGSSSKGVNNKAKSEKFISNTQIANSEKSIDTDNLIKPINSQLIEQESKPQEALTENQTVKVEQDMGKSQKTDDSQNQQQELNSKGSKSEDVSTDALTKSREEVKAAREAKKLAKLNAKKKITGTEDNIASKGSGKDDIDASIVKKNIAQNIEASIKNAEQAKTGKAVNEKSKNISADTTKPTEKLNVKIEEKLKVGEAENKGQKAEEGGKSKAELKAERRAKQEAQRAAKQAVQVKAVTKPDAKEVPVKVNEEKSEKSPKTPKPVEKSKTKSQSVQKVGWFQHLNTDKDKESLKNIPLNSHLHPAVIKLGVQLASHVVSGSNARCIALLDAFKKVVRDYSLPARTEFARGLEAQVAASAEFLLGMRDPTAAETNALKHLRRQLTQLPNNVDEFDAKKKLQEEIDRYIREQIDMAGEAISLFVRSKICPGDHILTYGCSSLIERALTEAWAAGVRFRATVVGSRGGAGGAAGARDMLRRLLAGGVPAEYADLAALTHVMNDVQKVVLGACALLANGAALGAVGGAQVALVARARNVPVLVACETHKFSERVHSDALVYTDVGDPDELIDKTDENSPIKDWRNIPNLTLLNLTYDVTPPSLITAVVTELGILPCTSAPVVLRFKLSEYGM